MAGFINSANIAFYGRHDRLPINLKVALIVISEQLFIEHLQCADNVSGTGDAEINRAESRAIHRKARALSI